MGAIAFLFAGQGAQYPGMGEELFKSSEAARAVFAAADGFRPGTSAQCFAGTKEELGRTANTQPCVFSVDLAAACALREAEIVPEAVCGFSLGEVAALTFAGAFSHADGFRLVCGRAQAMQRAAEQTGGGMAAVLKLTNEQVETLCVSHPGVYPVNYNCPGQLVAAGEQNALASFCAAAQAAGGRSMPLAVNGAFHSPYMAEAAEEFFQLLSDFSFQTPSCPVYANATASPYAPPYRNLLARQIASPVFFERSVRAMAETGIDTFVEVGPGKTLAGLVKKILPGAKVYNVQDEAGLMETIRALKGGNAC
ncbi:MAG TPA: ACP S-malonyltransferase [Feifaniaceae bacterium]|nr:ACP S-malonyltransferase [Feifaniaceae bacterium]